MVQRHIDEATKDVHDPKALALIGINEASGAFLGLFSMGVSMLEEYERSVGARRGPLRGPSFGGHTPGTVAQLAWALCDRNWAVRASAAKALARMNRAEMIPQLTEMINTDKDQPARLAAAAAIIRLKDHRRTAASVATPSVAATEQGRKP